MAETHDLLDHIWGWAQVLGAFLAGGEITQRRQTEGGRAIDEQITGAQNRSALLEALSRQD